MELIPFVLALILYVLDPLLGVLFFLGSPLMDYGLGDYTAIMAMFFLSIGLWFVRKNRVEAKDE